jgi:phosphoglycolate phosphatase
MNDKNHVFKAVLFDLDGTLINSLHDIADSMNRVLIKKGYETHDYDAYRYFIGRGLRNLVSNTLPNSERTEQNITNLFQELLQDYEYNLLNKTTLYKGVSELLNDLTDRKIRLSISSNKPDAFTKQIAEELLKPWHFEIVLGSGSSFPRKPDPSAALFICNEMGLQPKDFLYMGDTSIDMETASAAGMYGVGVAWGFRSKKELIEGGAKSIIDLPIQLLDLLV